MKKMRLNHLSCWLLIVLLLLSSTIILAQDDDDDEYYDDEYSDEYYDDEYDDEYYDDEYDDEYYDDEYDDEYYDNEYDDEYDIDCDSPDLSDDDYDTYCGEYYEDYEIDCESLDLSDDDFDYYCGSYYVEYDIDCDSPDLSDDDFDYYCDFDYEEYMDEFGDFIEIDAFDDNFIVGGETVSGNVLGEFEISDTTDLEGTLTGAEQQLWDAFKRIVPAEWVNRISSFEVIDDPETSGYVYIDDNDPTKFVLALNIEEVNDSTELNHTIVHELAHIITLNSAQVSNGSASCSTLALDEGCTNSNSYINQFNSQFWETDADGFVSDYASTDVAEDIAESFAAFVLNNKPAGNSVADQKINFFYNYPNLVQLRQEIRANIAGTSN